MTEAKDTRGGALNRWAGSSATFQDALEKAAGTALSLDALNALGTLIGWALEACSPTRESFVSRPSRPGTFPGRMPS